jgi:hypothetical protein
MLIENGIYIDIRYYLGVFRLFWLIYTDRNVLVWIVIVWFEYIIEGMVVSSLNQYVYFEVLYGDILYLDYPSSQENLCTNVTYCIHNHSRFIP